MDPIWRTAKVVELATVIHRERAWSRLPVLRDALIMDGGCSDDELLTFLACDGAFPNELQIQKILCKVIGGRHWQAVEQVEELAGELGSGYSFHRPDEEDYEPGPVMDFERLMGCGDYWLSEENGWGYTTQSGSEHWRTEFTEAVAEKFWKNYEIITGIYVEDKKAQFFSCSC